jgi:uncharacterized membrane protein HdeD (DUF308 family)
MNKLLKLSWWALLIRGVSAIFFGGLAMIWPGLTLDVLILFFGAYALVDGIFTGAAAIAHRKHDSTWWLFLFAGLAGAVLGGLTFLLPGLTALVLVYLIAARALIVGVIEIYYAIALRREISNDWFYAFNGILSILLGIVLFAAPLVGAMALVTVIGIFAIVIGLLLVIVAFRFRKLARQLS